MPTSLTVLNQPDSVADCCSPVVRKVITPDQAETLAGALKAIADPTRLRLTSLVASHEDQEACVCDLTDPVGLSQPTVSHHLKVLVDAGILTRSSAGDGPTTAWSRPPWTRSRTSLPGRPPGRPDFPARAVVAAGPRRRPVTFIVPARPSITVSYGCRVLSGMGGSGSVLHAIVSTAARVDAAHPAVTSGDDTWTYAELWGAVQAVAAGLRRDGLRRGDRVAVYLDKRLETVAAIFGTSCGSGVFVPVNPVLRAAQVGHILRDAGCRVLVTTPERYASLQVELATCDAVEVVVLVGATEAPATDAAYRIRTWSELVADSDWPPQGPAEPAIDVDVAAILYTSGSTGLPKGVVLSQRNLRAGADSVSEYLGNTSDDVILAALPLSFDAGLSQLTTGFTVGAHVVLHNYLLPGDVVTACRRHGVTGLTGVPPLWIQIAEQQWPADVTASLRYFANTGGRMPRPLLTRLREHFPAARPFLMYGLTEAFRSTYLDPAEVDRRPDSIGRAIPNTEILVVRTDGTRCEPGEVGELVHRGALVALGYWNDPERTALRFRPPPGGPPVETAERAVWSGDLVRADEEGFLYFVGRNDEMIKTSGYRVSPTEIEEIAFRSGLVRDAVALGDDDPALGQRVVLIVTPDTPGQRVGDALHRYFRRNAPTYMVPAVIDERTSIPRGPNGKYDRTWLRQERAS